MRYTRHYVQYNDLVFDEAEMVKADDLSASFKDFSKEYTYGHGSYYPIKSGSPFIKSGSLSLTITLNMKKLPCEFREFYPDFVKDELFKPGKLWAVHGNHLEWAYAVVTSYGESEGSRNDTLEIDVDFYLPEGYWHKADKLRTFLLPYDRCSFMECYDYKSINPCKEYCCNCAKPKGDVCLCCCDDITEDMALCYHMDELERFFDCDVPFHIKYDCAKADELFGDYLGNTHIGQQICTECGGTLSGMYYSDTNLPTDNVRIVIHGEVKDPYIEINGNGNTIRGEYDGTLIVNGDGSVYFSPENNCNTCKGLVDAGKWEVPPGNTYGWEIHHGNNLVIIETNVCCGTVCAYIDADSITP